MAHNGESNGTPETAFSWLKVWMTPFGLFIIGVVFLAFLGTYVVMKDRQETQARREAFCRSEVEGNKRERLLWETIITFSNERKTPAEIKADAERTERFRQFIRETYPIGDCPLSPGAVPRPTQERRR